MATTGKVPLLIAVKADMSPEPVAARPMLVELFVQEYVVIPNALLVLKFIAVVFVPLQTTWLAGWFA